MPDWFEQLTGFKEGAWQATRDQLEVAGDRLVSRVNGRSYGIGRLELPSLAELRERTAGVVLSPGAGMQVRTLVGEARALHAEPESRDALFQVASQFNVLEMASPGLTPEHGVTCYHRDPTQGPACAIAAGAATIYRNYFAPTASGAGQTSTHQINTLHDLAEALAPGRVPVRNGYALPDEDTVDAIGQRLRGTDAAGRDRLRGLLRIGLHHDVEVTEPGPGQGQRVSQAFCSALPVSYVQIGLERWEPFARLVLEAAYEATLRAALDHADRGGSRTVYLTLIGGGVFGNDPRWILDAMRHALQKVRQHPLDVCVVSYGSVPAPLNALVREFQAQGGQQ